MAFIRRRRNNESHDIWPGFVDALSTVLLVFIFVLVGFISSQIYLSTVIANKDTSMDSMQSEINELCSLLEIEKGKCKSLAKSNVDLDTQVKELRDSVLTLEDLFSKEKLDHQKDKDSNTTLQEKIENLNSQLKDLMTSLAFEKENSMSIKEALDSLKEENFKLSDLSKMNSYRSEFFDKMQQVLGEQEGIKVVGDRFVFQSELFFDTASATLSEEGKEQLSELAKVVLDIQKKIPEGVNWILRVDGHTDKRPISAGNGKFESNWELSAARAISVVKFLIQQGITAEHLVAAGFGEAQPISKGSTDEDYAKNRRIEFKLDAR